MEKLLLNNVEFDFDIADADNAENFEKAMKHVMENIEKVPEDASTSVVIRHQCQVVFDAFDMALGKGSSKKIFGEKTNIRVCQNVFAEFVDAIDAQKASFEKESNAMFERFK